MEEYITNYVWEKIYAYLKTEEGIYVNNEKKVRKFMNAISFILREGCRWRAISFVGTFGNYRGFHKRFLEWCRRGIWDRMLKHFGIDADLEYAIIDSTTARAHVSATGYKNQALGRSRGGFSTKLHVLVDALGQFMKIILSEGQAADITYGPELIKGIEGAHVIGDKGYDSDAFIEQIKVQNCEPAIPPRSNRKNPRIIDTDIYKERNVVELAIGKLKQFRRIAMRFDKLAIAFLGFANLGASLLWLR